MQEETKYIMRTFVKRAPVAEGVTPVPVYVGELSEQVLHIWNRKIQPVIRESHYRLDRNWNWSKMYRYLPIGERIMGRGMAGYAVQVQNDYGDEVPAGLVLLSLGFPALDDNREKSVFLWYLTAAPTKALRDLGISAKPKLLEILVDIALVVSKAQGYSGKIGLHAANEGGNPEAAKQLLENYHTRCHLLTLPPSAKIPGVRVNDGRYFYTTPQVAEMQMAALDYLR